MNEKKRNAEQTLAELVEDLKLRAACCAHRMNQQKEEGDLERNHVNSGELIEQLNVLRFLGREAESAVWDDDGYSICEYVKIDGMKIYEREKPVKKEKKVAEQ